MKTQRILILVMVFFLSTNGIAGNEAEKLDWLNLAQAQERSKITPKPILIDFTAAWCGWCKKMDKTTFKDQDVINTLSTDYYAVKVDFDSKVEMDYQGQKYTGKALAKKFGIDGLPTMILVSSDYSKSEAIIGYKTSKQLLNVLKRTDI